MNELCKQAGPKTIPCGLVALQRPAWKKLYPEGRGPPSTVDPSIVIIYEAYNEDF